MAVPLPDPIVRTRFLVKPDANVVLANRDGLTRIGLERIGLAAENDPDDLPLELGFFLGELGLVLVVVFVAGEIGGVEEKVFEGLGEEGVVVSWGSDLEPAHEGLEHEVVEVGGAGEGAHDRVWFGLEFGYQKRVLPHRLQVMGFGVLGFWRGNQSWWVRFWGFMPLLALGFWNIFISNGVIRSLFW